MTETTTLEGPKLTAAERMAHARAARKTANPESVLAPAMEAFEPVAIADEPAEAAVAEPTILEKVAVNAEDARQRKIEALRKAKVTRNDTPVDDMVTVRVLKRGAGLISMGEHVAGLGELTYDAGETPSLPRSVAAELEAKGLAEIQ